MLLANLTNDEFGSKWFMEHTRAKLPLLVDVYCKGKHFNTKVPHSIPMLTIGLVPPSFERLP